MPDDKLLKVKTLGLEVECGYDSDTIPRRDWEVRYPHLHFGTDGSVVVNGYDEPSAEIKNYGTPAQMFEWLDELYNKVGIGVNSTCGLHTHLRFENMDAALAICSSMSFWKDFRRRYVSKFRDNELYRQRLRNHYCMYTQEFPVAKILNQLERHSGKSSERYTAINLNAYQLYGTIEFRILPYQRDSETAISNLKWLIDTVEEIGNSYSEAGKTLFEDYMVIASLQERTEIEESYEIGVY